MTGGLNFFETGCLQVSDHIHIYIYIYISMISTEFGRYDIRPNFKNYPHSNLLPEFFTEILELWRRRGMAALVLLLGKADSTRTFPYWRMNKTWLSVGDFFDLFIHSHACSFWVVAALDFLPNHITFPSRGSNPSLVEDANIFSWNSYMPPQNIMNTWDILNTSWRLETSIQGLGSCMLISRKKCQKPFPWFFHVCFGEKKGHGVIPKLSDGENSNCGEVLSESIPIV